MKKVDQIILIEANDFVDQKRLQAKKEKEKQRQAIENMTEDV